MGKKNRQTTDNSRYRQTTDNNDNEDDDDKKIIWIRREPPPWVQLGTVPIVWADFQWNDKVRGRIGKKNDKKEFDKKNYYKFEKMETKTKEKLGPRDWTKNNFWVLLLLISVFLFVIFVL